MFKYKVILRDKTSMEIEADNMVNNSYYSGGSGQGNPSLFFYKTEYPPLVEDINGSESIPDSDIYIGDLDLEAGYMDPVPMAGSATKANRYPVQNIVAVIAGDQWTSVIRIED